MHVTQSGANGLYHVTTLSASIFHPEIGTKLMFL